MNILDKIIAKKKAEVASKKDRFPAHSLEKSDFFESPVLSLKESLLQTEGPPIIAEFKRRSPSRGVINPGAVAEKVTRGYHLSGAAALSVLTDEVFFGGTNNDLIKARQYNACPILRKDFTIDEYQVIEARSIGADAILLIAGILSTDEIQRFTALAHALQMEVILEIHDDSELEKLCDEIDIIGVNNRDLRNFQTSYERSLRMAENLPEGHVKISESGIYTSGIALELGNAGYNGLLIGEQFMKHTYPDEACREFIDSIRCTSPGTTAQKQLL